MQLTLLLRLLMRRFITPKKIPKLLLQLLLEHLRPVVLWLQWLAPLLLPPLRKLLRLSERQVCSVQQVLAQQ